VPMNEDHPVHPNTCTARPNWPAKHTPRRGLFTHRFPVTYYPPFNTLWPRLPSRGRQRRGDSQISFYARWPLNRLFGLATANKRVISLLSTISPAACAAAGKSPRCLGRTIKPGQRSRNRHYHVGEMDRQNNRPRRLISNIIPHDRATPAIDR
jgi:hypothetical protein